MTAPVRIQGRFARFLRGYGRLTIFLIPIGIATNFIGGQVANLLKLPMYLDSIGTILVGALCGGLPGALVGFISNFVNSITNPTIMPFALVSIVLGLLAGLLSRMGVFRSLWKTIVSTIPIVLIGSTIGCLITIWVFGGLGGNGIAIITGAVHALGMDLNTAVFVSSFPPDFLDKGITVIVVFLILSRIPDRMFVKVPLGHIYIGRKKRAVIDIPDDELALEL